jgi:hypothetical protein
MMKRLCLLSLGSLALTLMLPMGAALADAIDGNWCHAEAGRLEISGPNIVTPGGTQMQGIYGRHSFSYTVPQTETPAGATLNLLLIDDDTVQLTNGANTASQTPQIWNRCPASIS